MHPKHNFLSTIRLLTLSAALLPAIALASGTATMHLGGKTAQVIWQDSDTVRIGDVGDSEYLVIRDNKAYTVAVEDGKTQVVDLTGVREFLAEFGGELNNNPYKWGKVGSVKATKDSETIAGIEGKVYVVTVTKPDGQTETVNAVLSNQPLVTEMIQTYSKSLQNTFGIDSIEDLLVTLPKNERGLLRFGDYIRLQAISGDKPSDDLFNLPEKPISFGDLMQGGKN